MSSVETGSVIAILEDIVEALSPLRDEIPGLQLVPYMHSPPNPPEIDVYPSSPFQTVGGFGPAGAQLFFTIRARVSTADPSAGQTLLLQLLDPSGPRSVTSLLYERWEGGSFGEVSEYREYLEDQPTQGRLLGAEWRVTTFL